ncbi:ribonuclease HI [Novosphingobium album (ex Hu et al. 2023)]|uniref:Reverse transcriptase-like protein n=1 Tax=Novosphingobium album (ex Hu et al. 2023) TaxID=2930093 RepID=A0ABT0B2I8_9SPHN|nr:reverse transcriptase-like protein [Novosphingobium album (ex Hu et al. 2023)]MCJ2179272.1 reverse transcriptase-like protein [Novosphingobium album (ex Hu et al. 2023)]
MGRGRTKVYFDGGCRPNPGPVEVAVVVRGQVHVFDDLGHGTNSDAEWLALIRALELVQAQAIADAELIGDALEVVRQANAALAAGQAAPGHAQAFLTLAAAVRPARVRWIKRAQNLAGIALVARHPR